MAYSIDRLRKVREQKDTPEGGLADVPVNAPHDTDDAVGCWNGERFVSWHQWIIDRVFSDNGIRKIPGTNAETARAGISNKKRHVRTNSF